MEAYYIDLIPERGTPVYHVSQGDTNRTIRCNLYDGVQAIKLTGTESIRMRYRKQDGEVSSLPVINEGTTYIDVPIPADLTAAVGKVYCKLRIGTLGAKAFYIEVEGRP